MSHVLRKFWSGFIPVFNRSHFLMLALMVLLFSLTGCSRRSRVPLIYAGPAKVVVLPFNVPADNKEFRWTALAAPILMARISEQVPDIEIVP
ncbi:MAG TPA: hypothetical protein VLL97_05380, partial [Acidobacteriota bacterium]|nr:hypothetical protein [Acidobacteriota bacterium]